MIHLARLVDVDLIWPHLKQGMEVACKKGGGQYTENWLWTICRKGDAMLVFDMEGETIKAGCVCEVQNWTGRQVLYLHAVCGRDMKSWIAELREFGRETFGNIPIMFEGRRGWASVPGVKIVRHVFEIEVTP